MIPRAIRGLFALIQWFFGHPQPFLAGALGAAAVFGLWRLTASDAFAVTTIQMPAGTALRVPEVRGQNLWSVDVRAMAEALNAQQPELAWVRVTRVIPSTLKVDVLERTPAAQVQLGQWHTVDREGFVFDTSTAQPQPDLVILKGVADPKSPLAAGRVNANERLMLGVRLARVIAQAPVLKGHTVTTLDVGDPRQVSFILDDGIEVRCGSEEELAGQLSRLEAVLRRLARQSLAIRYIDVRFPEPVIGPKT